MDKRDRMVFVPKGIAILWDTQGFSLLKPYSIDREATTQREYLQYLMDTGQTLDPNKWDVRGIFNKTVRPREGTFDGPIAGVSWEQSLCYARWRGARLPTSVEWLRAMRGSGPTGWPSGNEPTFSALAETLARAVRRLDHDRERSEKKYDAIFAEVVAPLDIGDGCQPAITPSHLGEWTSESLGATCETWEDYYGAVFRNINRQADIEQARVLGRAQDIAPICAYYQRQEDEWKRSPLHQTFPKWEESEDGNFMHFSPEGVRHELRLENYLKKTLTSNLIGFRCAKDG